MFKHVKIKKQYLTDLSEIKNNPNKVRYNESDISKPKDSEPTGYFNVHVRPPLSVAILIGCHLYNFTRPKPSHRKCDDATIVLTDNNEIIAFFKKGDDIFGVYEAEDIDLGQYEQWFNDPEEVVHVQEIDYSNPKLERTLSRKLRDFIDSRFSQNVIDGNNDGYAIFTSLADTDYKEWVGYTIFGSNNSIVSKLLAARIFLNKITHSDYSNDDGYFNKDCNLTTEIRLQPFTYLIPLSDKTGHKAVDGKLVYEYSNGTLLVDVRSSGHAKPFEWLPKVESKMSDISVLTEMQEDLESEDDYVGI